MLNLQEEKLKAIIKYEDNLESLTFRQWFLKQFDAEASNSSCTLEEFVIYFLNTLRQCTEVHLKPSGIETPKCQTPERVIKSNNTREDSAISRRLMLEPSEQDTSTPNDKNNNLKNENIKINSYNNIDLHFTSHLSISDERSGLPQKNATSTPIRRTTSNGNSRRLSSTSGSVNKSSSSPHSLCLGDFLVLNTSTNNRSHKKKSASTANRQTQTDKPKKRVQPINISKKAEKPNSSIFDGESSFSSENNIVKVSNSELENKDQCVILAARKSLKFNASEISTEIKNDTIPSVSVITDMVSTSIPPKGNTFEEYSIDLKKLENNISLKRLAEVYALIIDLNLATNILNELAFLLNLLNAPSTNNNEENQRHFNDTNSSGGLECLEDLSHAVYFALLCLSYEKESLASLDTKSLSVVLISERFSYLSDDVKTYLLETYQRKQQLVAENPFCNTSLCFDSKLSMNVYFQQEQDSRENFSSHQEFSNFRVQRDLFCKCLKLWESNHLNTMWKFSIEIAPKIREIFKYSENCLNMAHLAKLFVSQLLLSVSNSALPEEIGLDVDLQKFSKLTQRLIAPSQFSVDYQFPRSEAFFRDFILESRSLAFTEQLKIELYKELITRNDSSFDYINLSKTENDADEQSPSLSDHLNCDNVIVRPAIINSMLILAKFLGFTTSLPYNLGNNNTMPAEVEKNQISLRTLMQSTFDISAVFEQGIQQNKLLITIPWMVQYFAMLDNVTMQLEHYMKTLKLMFALYSYLGLENPKPFNNTSLFIIKLCLGWLFESKQFITEQYYNYRGIFYKQNSKEPVNELTFLRNKLSCKTNTDNKVENNTLNPYLESILPIACPFLAKFRVSIMPAKYAQTKSASRSGRYRHITTRIAKSPSIGQIKDDDKTLNADKNQPKQIQNYLIQTFYNSQSSSARLLINFCTERCFKCVVKDGQFKILLPIKTNADNLVNEITSSNYRFVYDSINTIYSDAHVQAETKWNNSIHDMLQKRIRNALESLLPEETSSILKRTYFIIIKKEAEQKISKWFETNIIKENYFCANLQEMANKICNSNKKDLQLCSSQLIITKESPSVSDLIDEIQYWLYCTSIRVDRFKGSGPLIEMLRKLPGAFDNALPSLLYNLLAASVIQLLQHIIAKHCTHLTEELIEVACDVWLHPNMQIALESSSSSYNSCIYDALVTIAFIKSLDTKTSCFNKLSCLIVTMIKKKIISVNYANDLVVSLFEYEWFPNVLSEISNLLRTIAEETATVSHKPVCDNNINIETDDDDNGVDKSNLFMDMLAGFSRDVDSF